MKAKVIERFGDSSVFTDMEIPKPNLRAGHVLIRVHATSVNPVDCKIRQGALPSLASEFPIVLHGDVAGLVEAVGEGVNHFQVGDEVYACAGGIKGCGGALAEWMLADADLVAKKPKSLTMREAAALPLVTITAWESLIDRAKVKPGQNVLIYGATGGVGHIAVQLAKWSGAKVFATASTPEKSRIAQQLDVDSVINYRRQTVDEYVAEFTDGRGFDVVFDTVGNDHLKESFEAVMLNGTVVSTLALSSQDLSPIHVKGLTFHVVFMLIPMLYGLGRSHHGEILAKAAQLVDEGKIRPLIDSKTFRFSEIAEAHQYAESGQAIGKVTIERD